MKETLFIMLNGTLVFLFYLIYIANRLLRVASPKKVNGFRVWYATETSNDILLVIGAVILWILIAYIGIWWILLAAAAIAALNIVAFIGWVAYKKITKKPWRIKDFYGN